MKPFLIGLVLSLVNFSGRAQCPNTPVTLQSQADIDNFAVNYPNCTNLSAPLYIDEVDGVIDNLLGLSSVESAYLIKIQNTHIEHLNGLENLIFIQELWLNSNYSLIDFTGLDLISNIDLLNVIDNTALESTNGLGSLSQISQLNFFDNTSLTDLTALSQITQLNGLRIAGNNLTTLDGLNNLVSVNGEIFVSNEQVINLDVFAGLNNLTASLFLWNNPELIDVSVFQDVTQLQDLVIVGCNQIQGFQGFENLTEVEGIFRLGFNPQMTDLTAFGNLTRVGSLDIYENDNLVSLDGLEGLIEVTEAVYLMDNPNLTDIDALQSLNPQGLQQLVIARNTSLSACDNDFVCQVIFDPEISEEIQGNANGCNSVPQVAARCILEVPQAELLQALYLWPSPANQRLNVMAGGALIRSLDIHNVQGELIDTVSYNADQSLSQAELNVSAYASGLYFISINTDQGLARSKFIKH